MKLIADNCYCLFLFKRFCKFERIFQCFNLQCLIRQCQNIFYTTTLSKIQKSIFTSRIYQTFKSKTKQQKQCINFLLSSTIISFYISQQHKKNSPLKLHPFRHNYNHLFIPSVRDEIYKLNL